MVENVEKRLLLQTLLIGINHGLPEKVISNRAYHIAKGLIRFPVH